MAIRVRFAPSPTGPLHIGGVRTALYNYLFAKQNGGSFILRLEDTDQERFVEGAESYIVDSLNWFGLLPDEGPEFGGSYGPYRQSERKSQYGQHAQKLIQEGKAYYAFDTEEELEQMRARLQDSGVHMPRYDYTVRSDMRNSLTLDPAEVKSLLDSGAAFTIRLLVHPGNELVFEDAVRGEVRFKSEELDDKVLVKSDGMPTYHLANVVDDHLMEITHVIRGEEWLSSTPHHVLLYQSFGWEMPQMAHLPLILKPSGKGKLSKRDGAQFGFPVFPIDWNGQEHFPGYREAGFEPEAVLNFLAFLGWNPGTEQELFSLEELIEAFSLEHIVKGGARFDYDKALWFNQQHLIHADDETLAERLLPRAREKGYAQDIAYITQVVGMMKERVHLLPEIIDQGYYLFESPQNYDLDMVRKKWGPDVADQSESLIELLRTVSPYKAEELATTIKAWIQEKGLKMGQVLPILRLGLTGTMQGPDVFQTIELFGPEESANRMKIAFDFFQGA